MTQPVDEAPRETVRIRILEGEKQISEKVVQVKKVVLDHLVQIVFDGPVTVAAGQTLSIEGPLLLFR